MVLEDVYSKKNFLRSLVLRKKYAGVVFECSSHDSFGIHIWIWLFWNPNYRNPEPQGWGIEWYLLRWAAEFERLLQWWVWYFFPGLFEGVSKSGNLWWFLYFRKQDQSHSGRKHFYLPPRLQPDQVKITFWFCLDGRLIYLFSLLFFQNFFLTFIVIFYTLLSSFMSLDKTRRTSLLCMYCYYYIYVNALSKVLAGFKQA